MRRIIRLLKWGMVVATLAACAAGGVALSGLLRPAAPPALGEGEGQTAAGTPGQHEGAEVVSEATLAAAGDPARFDRLLADGRFAEALAAADRLREKVGSAGRDALDYRVALCLEVLGRQEEALTAYEAVVARAPDTPAGAEALAGQARLWLRAGKPALARKHLADLLLRAGRPPLSGHPALADVAHLLAVAMAREAAAEVPPAPGNLAPAHPVAEAAVAPAIAAVKWDAPAPPAAAPAAVPAAVKKDGTSPDSWTVTAGVRQAVALDFLGDVAQKAGLEADWSPEARRAATGQAFTVAAERMPFTDLLRAAAASLNIAYGLKDGKVTFSTAPAGSAARLAAARRSLVEVSTTFPEHPLSLVVAVESGNLELVAGRYKEAAGAFDRLIRERPRAPLTEAYYDLGLARARLGERGLARDAFFRVADRDPSGRLAGLAYLHIGRLYLEDANPALAARALRRVQAGNSSILERTCAALLQAAAELLDDNPRAAHAAIASVQTRAAEEPFIRPAALLDALSRYRAIADPERRQRAAGDLLEALLAYHEEHLLGPVGLMLAGQAYRDLDLGDEMAALYEKAQPGVGTTLALAMKADLAEHLLASGKKGAVPLLRAVAAASGPPAVRAQLRLAEIALKEKRPDECLKLCQKVLASADASAAGDATQLMGQAYTQKGDHASAARCFSGRPPGTAPAGASVTQ